MVAAEARLIAAMDSRARVDMRDVLEDMTKECEGRYGPQKDWTELKEP